MKFLIVTAFLLASSVFARDFQNIVCADGTGTLISIAVVKNAFPKALNHDGLVVEFHTGNDQALAHYFEKRGVVKDGSNQIIRTETISLSEYGIKVLQDAKNPLLAQIIKASPKYLVQNGKGETLGTKTVDSLFLEFDEVTLRGFKQSDGLSANTVDVLNNWVRIVLPDPNDPNTPELMFDRGDCKPAAPSTGN